MAKIFLISANTNVEPYPVYPIGMSVIAGALEDAGHEVIQYDMLASGNSLEHLRSSLTGAAPHYAGISIRNVDNVDSFTSHSNKYIHKAKLIVDVLKEAGIPVIAGGAGFSLLPEEILEFTGADYGIVGEGERKMVELIGRLEAGRAAEQIYGREQGIPGNEIPVPRWEPQLLRYYIAQSGVINVQTKRGCEHCCAYCTYPYLEGRKMRVRPVSEVADELEMLRNYGADNIFFTDSVLNDRAGHYLLLAEEIVRREIEISWCGFFQPGPIEDDELALLKRSGLQAMEVGTDATSDTTLKGLHKSFNFGEVIEFNEKCVTQRIPCAHFVIFGGPGETMDTVREGIKNMNSLQSCVVFPFSGIRLHEGTPLFTRAVKEGLIRAGQSLLEPFYYFSPRLDKDEMNAALMQGFKKRRDRLFPPDEGQQRINIMKKFGFRGILWDQLIKFDDQPANKISSQPTAGSAHAG
ncbi:lipid biosynthesis B12-binding/radical SAM protein [Desulfovibrio sp. JC010]|uniref:lipid biosynthesis B12-binding/radical SAM protein n=1 Tax=Desulfovibrio sp. JC010 TaxID=2593641 RepID=UPI0013D4DF92|nr:lipid biosynthesis B12-binding/radical SAM protein [Desulfovibrio sp. JC010]NDV26736.1 lipid biosynthesis B12-binding/radical SAM protein [Desulfovibrio sp. JC010]